MSTALPYIPLRVRSAYSLLEGAIRVKELVGLCKASSTPACALTDQGNMFGSLEFALACADAGIQPIMGCLLPLKTVEEADSRNPAARQPDQLLLLAKDATGYQNLMALASKAFLEPADNRPPSVNYTDLDGNTEGLIALTAGQYGIVGKALAGGRMALAEEALAGLMDLFPGRLYIELMRHGLEIEKQIEPGFIELGLKYNIPFVATNDVYFATADQYEAHDALLCISDGAYISETNRRRLTPDHRFRSPDEMRALFADIPEAIENTAQIAQRCAFMAPARAPMLPRFVKDDALGMNENDALRDAARAGLERRLERHVFTKDMAEDDKFAIAKPYRERLQFELETIISMGFPGYFLIVSDFITWSKEQNIPVGPGRGSGAGSVVAWSLSITDLDPLRYGLLFERFLNPERVSMPDFDVDFCQDRRDEVIDYVQRKYGSDRVAQIITFGKLQARAVLRDVGRVLQMPYGQVDRICKMVPNNPAQPVTLQQAIDMEPMLRSAIREDETVAKLTDIGKKLEGLYRHASTHAAGVVIADRPLQELVPLYRDPGSTMPVVQYSMKYAESAGLVKFDFLGLKTLTVLQKTLELLEPRKVTIDLLQLPEGDKQTYQMLSRGDTTGVFQLESAGMRDTLRRLKPDSLEEIIALVSLYRPGPMDNIPTYIARKHGYEKPTYLHPKLEEVLKETFGVIIYQEQVMQIAQLLAGYSLGEADLLRRAMGKKIRSEMEAQREIFVTRAVQNGVGEEQARSIFDLIAKFAEYGFNKSHAAAYAVIAYQTAYLKANYPVEFLAGSMTYDMQNTDKLGIFREEAERFGIALLPPDINASGVQFTVENGAIRYALAAVKNVGAQAMHAVVKERTEHGPYKDLFDFASRLDSHVLNRRQLEHLAKAGAFDSINPNRKQVFDTIDVLIGYCNTLTRERESQQTSLFAGGDSPSVPLPNVPQCEDWMPQDRLHNEFSAIGFYLSSHPLAGYGSFLKRMRVTTSGKLSERLGTQYGQVKLAGIVTGKKLKVSDKGRFAFIQLSDAEGVFEASIFKEELLTEYRDLLETGSLVLITADGKKDENGPRLIIQNMTSLDEAAKEHGRGEIRVGISDGASLERMKTLMGEPLGASQGMKVGINATMADGATALIDLPGSYALTPQLIGQMRVLPGISHVEEM